MTGLSEVRWLERRLPACFLGWGVFIVFQPLLFAQSGNVPSAAVPAGDADSRFVNDGSPTEAPLEVIYRMDRNGDGRLDPTEIPEGAEWFVIRMASEAGVDPIEPFPLKEFSRSWLKFAVESRRKMAAEPGAAPEDPFEPESTEAVVDWADVSRIALAVAAARGVMGIDPHLEVLARMDLNGNGMLEPAEIPQGAEAHVSQTLKEDRFSLSRPVSLATLAETRRRRRQARTGTIVENQTTSQTGVARVRTADSFKNSKRFAENLLRLYDANQDGLLDKSEWTQLNPDWSRADRNRDRRLTIAEVADHLGSIQQANVNSVSAAPKGLPQRPGWFTTNDANRDGQIQMHEFTRQWTDTKIAEFREWDRNDDGVITPKEFRSHEKR